MPNEVGTGFKLPRILTPLEGLRDHINVDQRSLFRRREQPLALPGLLHGLPRTRRAATHPAEHDDRPGLRPEDRPRARRSRRWSSRIEDSSNSFGTCAGDFLCTYMDTISWRTPTQPLPMEINPRVVFERMFGGDGTTAEARRVRLESEHEHSRRRGRGRPRPRARPWRSPTESGSTSISRTSARSSGASCKARSARRGQHRGAADAGRHSGNLRRARRDLMFELQALAFQGDMTRVTSFMMARELSAA